MTPPPTMTIPSDRSDPFIRRSSPSVVAVADRQDTGRRWLPGERTCADPAWGIGKLR
jgi:hypothetical protein